MDSFFVMRVFHHGLLLRDWNARIRFGHFYLRRCARICRPHRDARRLWRLALFLPDFRAVAVDAAIAFAYLTNWARAGFIHVNDLVPVSYLGHTWSLAIEEQFYILWPAILVVLLRRLDVTWRLFWVIVWLALGIWAWRVWLTLQGAPWFRLYNGLDTRADALLAGCALAVWLRLARMDHRPDIERRLAALAWPTSWYSASRGSTSCRRAIGSTTTRARWLGAAWVCCSC
jgi:peptidoglycan/LPS O-acetylase OafA/YrhL